ncbi:ABC transporter permease [Staphylococcus sp. Marseille-Q5304]|uniref:FtsX-like permease family protein n=1 Tax=Staphylococcus sp. Marseille-Q5304 TaxID=2942200 RepID=UPI0020730757|nr:ABC transporter permease [Staphylococcus sp. Marseille-Q5304]
MNFNQIVLKNFRQNLRHYAMYIFSLILSIIIYFSFVTLKYTHSINNDNSAKIIQKGSEVGANFLFVIIIVFLMYANYLFIKRRTREFALFQLIGLTRKNIMRMIIIEQLAMFVSTGVIGILIGIFGSKLLLMIVLKMLNISISVKLTLHSQALIQTILLLFLAFVFIVIHSYLFLRRRSILTMMKDNTQGDAKNAKISIFEVIFGIIGIVMIVYGYYLAKHFMNYLDKLQIILPFIILFLTTVGAYLFFRSSVSMIFKTLKRSKKGNVSITDVVFTSSIMHKMKKNALALTIIATISAITVTVLCFGAIYKASTETIVNETSPQDFNVYKEKQAQQFENKLDEHHIPFKKDYKETASVKLKKDNVFEKPKAMPKQDNIMTVTSNKFFHDDDIHGNQIKLINTQTMGAGMFKHHLGNSIQFDGLNNSTFKVNKEDKKVVFSGELTHDAPVILVKDQDYNKLKHHAKEIHSQYGFDLKNQKDWSKANKLYKSLFPKKEQQSHTTKKEITKTLDSSNGIILFVSSFLGLAFLVAAGCIIYIKQMDETEDEISNFRILQRMGYTHRDMMTGLGLKIFFNFSLPLVVSLLHAFFASTIVMKLSGVISMMPVFIVMVIYTLVYFIFAIMAFIHSNRVVKHSI